MREILFRGKRTDNGEWVEGGLLYDEEQNEAYIAEHFEDKHAYFRPIIPETIGEFTGLTDKNGNKIFEGDIVKYGDTVHKVIFENRNKTAYFGLVYSPLETLPFGHYQDLRQIEVIGNIYDNPEILKKGQ